MTWIWWVIGALGLIVVVLLVRDIIHADNHYDREGGNGE